MYPSAALSFPVHRHLPCSFPADRRPRSRSSRHWQVASFGWDDYRHSSLVDENMALLRKRIHETKVAETNHEAPENWMDWEKRYYETYHADVCEILCLLQTVMMSTRPSLAIGILATLALSVPTSAVLISIHLVDAFKETINVAGAMHLG